jgi:hypothetical protein
MFANNRAVKHFPCPVFLTSGSQRRCTTYESHLFLRPGCYNTSAWLETGNRRAVRGGIMIPEDHPLQKFFMELVGQHYAHEIGIRDPELVVYVAHLLAEFCEVDQLFKIHSAADKPITDVGEMLLQADPVFGPAPSFDRERQIRKHIGDYTLFFTGMFPESINHLRLRRHRLDESWQRELLHRFEIRLLRIYESRAAIRKTVVALRAVRVWVELRKE